ncbi:MAG: SPOR domain-containing protein, partial [Xanthomonadales bacterium]|nr:SPOR domain-containing protein [Xanthomonadales bacterium]
LHLLGEALARDAGPGRLARCFSLGPFSERTDLGTALRRMNRGRGWNEIRETRALVERGWWVYLPRFEDRAAAESAALELRDAGISDLAVMLSGAQVNTVSLGLYDREEYAAARLEAVRAMGFDAQMRVRREPRAHYWLDYDRRALPMDGDQLAAELDVYNRPMPCPQTRPVPAETPQPLAQET